MKAKGLFIFSIVAVVLGVLLKFLSPGWLLLIFLFFSLPLLGIYIGFYIVINYILKNFKRIPLSIMIASIATGLFWVIGFAILPDYGDSGGFYILGMEQDAPYETQETLQSLAFLSFFLSIVSLITLNVLYLVNRSKLLIKKR